MITIKATPNYSKRTFTIRKYDKGHVYAKYRTSSMRKDEFEDLLMNTDQDWLDYLRNNELIDLNN